jgi:hypothetical protein
MGSTFDHCLLMVSCGIKVIPRVWGARFIPGSMRHVEGLAIEKGGRRTLILSAEPPEIASPMFEREAFRDSHIA